MNSACFIFQGYPWECVYVVVVTCMHPQLSPLANLGCKAHTSLTNGEALDDALLNDIFIQEIQSLPEGSGWILDNYPTTVQQAKVCIYLLTL